MVITPVSGEAPPLTTTHPKRGEPSAVWTYCDAEGRALGHVCRFDDEGGKEVLPLTYCEHSGSQSRGWRWKIWPPPRPLYGLDRLAARPDAPVLVCEGEKACDAAQVLLPDFVCVTSSAGSNAAGKADWSPLAGRAVTLWPDADAAGAKYAGVVARLARKAGATAVSLISLPEGVDDGWDAADAASKGWDTAKALSLVEGAQAAEEPMHGVDVSGGSPSEDGGSSDETEMDGKNSGTGKRRRPPQRDNLIGLIEEHEVELWHSPEKQSYATIPVSRHLENWPLRSAEFRRWATELYYTASGGAIGGQAMEDCRRVLDAKAVNNGACYVPYRRAAWRDDRVYLDLCNPGWSAVEIDRDGWRLQDKAPVKFLRSHGMRALPEPEAGETIEALHGFLNVETDEDRMMVVACLVAALAGQGPFPILVLNGEQGSGKSVASRMLRSLVDPNIAPIRAAPREERDLIISACNAHLIVLDNLSGISPWLSDALCRLSTGGGFATRRLHSDREEELFYERRPAIINGIPDLANRADLADRAITVHLKAIPEEARRPEGEALRDFEAATPYILGALLDAVSTALRNLPGTRLGRTPRMADFAKLISAAEPGLGWEPGSFLKAYDSNRREVAVTAFEANPLAIAVTAFVRSEVAEMWEGTASDLLAKLNACTAEGIRKSRAWPASPSAMGSAIRRIAPLLRQKGFAVEHGHSKERFIRISPQN